VAEPGVALAYGLSLVVFTVWLGFDVANWAFGLMIGLHATSAVTAMSYWSAARRFCAANETSFLVLMGGGVAGLLAAAVDIVEPGGDAFAHSKPGRVVNPRVRAAQVRRGRLGGVPDSSRPGRTHGVDSGGHGIRPGFGNGGRARPIPGRSV